MNKTIIVLGVLVLVLFVGALGMSMRTAPGPVAGTPDTIITKTTEVPRATTAIEPTGGADTGNEYTPSSGDGGQQLGDAPRTGFAKLAVNAIYVPEQQLTTTVVVTQVNIEPAGYLVVYTTENGKAAEVLGSTELAAGTQAKNVKVVLTRPMKDGEALVAQLHTDNGDGKFDVMSDSPVLDFTENPLSMTFYAMADASDPSTVEVMF